MLDPSALAPSGEQKKTQASSASSASLLPVVCTLTDIWKASALVSASFLQKLSNPKFDLAPINAAMQATSGAKLDPGQKKSIAKNLDRLAGVQTYPLRVDEGLYGESVGITSWPNDGNYISKSWKPAAHPSYAYTYPAAPDYTGEGLNDYAFPDLSETEILKRWPDEAPVSMLWSCAIMRTLHAINSGIIDKKQGISIGNNPVVDALKKEATETAKRLTSAFVSNLLGGDSSDGNGKGIEPKDFLDKVIAGAVTWLESIALDEIKQHSVDITNQRKVLSVADKVYPKKDAFLSAISKEYSFSIGKRKEGVWLSYEEPFTYWGQVATHDTILGAAAQATGLTQGEYEGVYSGAMMSIFGSFGSLQISSDDRESVVSRENIEAGKKARDAWASEIGYWRRYQGKISQYGNAYDNRKPNTKWRV